MVILQDLGFNLFFFLCFNHCLGAACDCRRCLSVAFDCRVHGATFICVKAIQTSKIYQISDKKSNQWLSICYKNGIISIIVTIIISNV